VEFAWAPERREELGWNCSSEALFGWQLMRRPSPKQFILWLHVSDGNKTTNSFVDAIRIVVAIFAAKTDSFGEYRLYNMQTKTLLQLNVQEPLTLP
jgi:hypothetical protein